MFATRCFVPHAWLVAVLGACAALLPLCGSARQKLEPVTYLLPDPSNQPALRGMKLIMTDMDAAVAAYVEEAVIDKSAPVDDLYTNQFIQPQHSSP